MSNGTTTKMHFVSWSDFAINFLQNHTVKRLDKGKIVMSVWKWKMVCARKHVYSWGIFAINFLKNYTLKWLENEYSNNQGHWERD